MRLMKVFDRIQDKMPVDVGHAFAAVHEIRGNDLYYVHAYKDEYLDPPPPERELLDKWLLSVDPTLKENENVIIGYWW